MAKAKRYSEHFAPMRRAEAQDIFSARRFFWVRAPIANHQKTSQSNVFKVRTLARTHAYLTAKKEFEFVDHHSLNILSLCAGVGGLDLGIRVAQPNARAVCFVEIEAFACEILATRMGKTKAWTKRLFGRIYDPLTASHGVASWIASLRDIRASHSPSPENKKAKTTRVTSGQMCTGLCGRYAHGYGSSKTSPDIYDWGLNKSMMTFENWVTGLRQACSQRRKSARLTNGNASSFWRTVKATEPTGGCLSSEKFKERMNAGMPLSLRDQVKHLWPTVRVSSANGPCQKEIQNNNPKCRLEVSVVNWPTPTAQDYKKRGPNSSQKGLAETSVNWATPNTLDHLPVRSPEAMDKLMGPNGQRAGRSRPSNLREQIMWPTVTAQDSKNNAGPSQFVRNTKPLNVEAVCHSHPDPKAIGTESQPVLNPQFVEWLMGWPIGWTEFAPVETVLSHWLPLMRGAFLQLQQMEENKNHD